jgi:hypothetical protein
MRPPRGGGFRGGRDGGFRGGRDGGFRGGRDGGFRGGRDGGFRGGRGGRGGGFRDEGPPSEVIGVLFYFPSLASLFSFLYMLSSLFQLRRCINVF